MCSSFNTKNSFYGNSTSKSNQIGLVNRAIQKEQSFFEVVAELKERLCYDDFPSVDKERVNELIRIMAEIIKFPDDFPVKINGEKLPAGNISCIYNQLEAKHIEAVIENFKKVPYKINYVKTYLRTALYNSFFVTESQWDNEDNIE